ncbi:GNAT family N-acetyltransferase [Shewanella sp. 202IG2-18]|uniref:GNAT family N-acetyltransferase n=1 Tax=Parashewanella hymeniacidonis TaxID=2807618 RepID=UPI00195FD6DA|nr:GNAT family N-acetyltransferase [Parashewanella hymeniacidonis]MBM7072587.1 GNAT family N-acetyltransferase [Parashewanella hymeniacidonis]
MYKVTIKAVTSLKDFNTQYLDELNKQIPELDTGISLTEIERRIADKPFLLLLAFVEGDIAGYKLGYEIDEKSFYSWVGGVAQDFRKIGVAETLLIAQENWVKEQSYQILKVKTQNRYNGMLSMLIKHQYQILNVNNESQDYSEYKMLLAKSVV